MQGKQVFKNTITAAFVQTIPILAGFAFLGIAYGIYMNALGFSAIYPILMSLLIFAGSMEFVAAHLLLGQFDLFSAIFLTLTINARHLFYGLSMLEKYNIPGWKKYYLIFGMCDESFSINCTAEIPENADKNWFMFFVTLFNHIYWVMGATIGGIFGSMVTFDTKGLEFVMTALFVVIFLDQWLKEQNHFSSLLGLAASIISLLIFGSEKFIIPAMLIIFTVFIARRNSLMNKGVSR